MGKITPKKRHALLIGATIAAALTSVASAVSLGVNQNNALGAGTSVTSTCQPTSGPLIAVAFDTAGLAVTSGNYTASTVTLSNIAAACNNKPIKLTVLDASNNALATYSGTILGTSLSAVLSTPVSASSSASVAIVING